MVDLVHPKINDHHNIKIYQKKKMNRSYFMINFYKFIEENNRVIFINRVSQLNGVIR